MTDMSKEAMKLALEALITASGHVNNEAFVKVMMARDALAEALAEQPAQQQEPVAWTATRLWNRRELWTCPADIERDLVEGYASPPAQRKPLTPEWIWTWLMDWCKHNGTSPANHNSLFKMVSDARAIEAAHNIKENT